VQTYLVFVVGDEGRVEAQLALECETDQEAANLAFGATTPFGLAVWADRRFVGWFPAHSPLGDRRAGRRRRDQQGR